MLNRLTIDVRGFWDVLSGELFEERGLQGVGRGLRFKFVINKGLSITRAFPRWGFAKGVKSVEFTEICMKIMEHVY